MLIISLKNKSPLLVDINGVEVQIKILSIKNDSIFYEISTPYVLPEFRHRLFRKIMADNWENIFSTPKMSVTKDKVIDKEIMKNIQELKKGKIKTKEAKEIIEVDHAKKS